MSDTQGPLGVTTWHRHLFARVERWPWLKSLEESVSAVSQPLYDRHRDNLLVELMHGGRWAGHSLHAALSDLPIGFWAGTVVLDALGKDSADDRGGLDAAGTLSAAGLLAAAGTVATGFTDWTVSDGDDRRTGLFHGLLNLAGTALQGASLVARVHGHRRPAQVLGLASMAVTGAAGYVGGHLVQGKAVMVNRVATTTGPTRWVQAVQEADLPDGASAGVTVDGRQVMLHRSGDDVHAIDDLCSHAGALLSRGPVVDCVVTCPLHESRFDLRDGRIVRGPAHHPQPVLPTRIRNGWVEVRGSLPAARRKKS
ncbi:non-heme iron oxygenase ferredoxin subunit [Pseudonocardia sp. KRD-184]|uniref:Non-heme iron oxygenase ferredoxin subunit n=1 Tax=Pseudonocardia oceani TaxID=2792013 RepID=A0ABS6U809_9PSEU|nr:non-heme iron oxygenase ferredoxin subunit [Pseudonocardia oceani]MBW0090250.1 non-heme iron oxygenase ferredoxin subunit [Pseudonocardia oceani]MBW0097456.1 non-heme iron oxygenase ferredoxin subunit [Pseudonocardia oceani]MBW0109691.1 non-heme iron oxygenase ferredoxin subunit [Pseudonocardia oceani]MBW0122048.1 non-heme iron oxygenase ferredoxin subunit [Pseudonocardia oceani]MBW0128348.1 non-heme iron oxygenase ferredoxin subunit [Pseudonocardia oceani]